MKSCPHCGSPMKPKAMEIEVEANEPDDEIGAKDEILAELLEQLGGSLEHKLKSKAAK